MYIEKIVFVSIFLCAVGAFFSVFVRDVAADAWWGEGYRPPSWVLRNGGTIINYSIINASSTKKYKAMMFRGGGYVEVEFGGSETFDDAKNGLYTINFYKCDGSCEDQRYDEKSKIRGDDELVGTINIVARPAQTNYVVFDAATGHAYVARRTGGIDPFTKHKKAAQEHAGEAQRLTIARERAHRFDQMTYLSAHIDFDKFKEINVKTGIIPDFASNKDKEENI